jgi:cysteinyl-tRNA synthetase
VHHENEIAQSEALLGHPAVKYWLHGEFLLVDNGKMSKSLGNTYTIADLKAKGYKALTFRYFCLNAHYRNKLNFTWDALHAAQVSLERLYEGALAHKLGNDEIDRQVIDDFRKEFDEAIFDDLNIPKALGVVWNIVRYGKKSRKLFDLLVELDSVLGLDIGKAEMKEENNEQLDPEIEELVNKRQQARKEKDWKLADEIRDKLKEMGIVLEDTPQGVKWRRV